MGKGHKNENTFKFRTFSDRLSDVHLDAVRRTTRLTAVPEDADTFFNEALQKWSDLNRTGHYTAFRAEIRDQVQSLTQLVYHKDTIIDVLQHHLKVEGSTAASALMDLTVQLARDLQQDFYPYFADFFRILVSYIMKPGQSVELLEAAFTALSFLFKILWREMVKDITNVLDIYAPLFSLNKREHIQKFAAESIAFVIRKVKDREHLFERMFERLRKFPKEVQGYGLILYEMMRGVKNQLHSCTEMVLPLILSKLSPNEDCILHTLVVAYRSLLDHVDVNQCQLLWSCTLNCVDEKVNSEENRESLTSLINLIHVLCEHNRGKTLKESDRLTKIVVSILRRHCDVPTVSALFELIIVLLQNSSLQTRQVHDVITEIFKAREIKTDVVLEFVQSVFSVSCFEQSILLPFLNYCHQVIQKDSELSEAMLCVVTKLILDKCLLPESSENDQRQYILDFSTKVRGRKTVIWLGQKLMDILSKLPTATLTSELWCALVCLPHIRPLPDSCADKIGAIMINLLKNVDLDNSGYSTILYQGMLALDHVTDRRIHDVLKMEDIVRLLKVNHEDVNILRAVDLYTTRATASDDVSSILDDVTGVEMMASLKLNLTSCYKMVRLLTVRILSKFQFQLPANENPDLEIVSVFRICLQAEKIPLSVSDYRNKLFHLSKLEYQQAKKYLPTNGQADSVPLMFLIGSMYNNFSLLWLPIRQLIESHARGMSRDQFWPIFADHLELLACRNESFVNDELQFDVNSPIDGLFRDTCMKQVTHVDQPDFGIVRYHLWKSMQWFASLCETKSKTLCPLLFRFLENEYYIHDMNAAPTQDLRKKSGFSMDETVEDDDAGVEEDLPSDAASSKSSKKGKQRTPITKYLIAHLELFTKFKSPKSLTMETQLLELYHKLLCHRYQNVQKVALGCLMTYKYKYLTPYKENLDKILDDAQFKDEIVRFSLSEENGVIDSEHREKLIPILMRLLYGRMISKTGKETAGKQHATLRKTLVLRFLGGCRQEELRVFMDLVFGGFKQYCSDNLAETITHVLETVDVGCVLPVRQQQSALHTIDVVFSNLGNSIDSYLSDLFQIITCVTASAMRLLDERESLLPQAVNSLKTLRTLGLTRIMQFFSSFVQYEFVDSDIEGLFVGVIWPLLKKLPYEGIHSPTALLKLLHIWSTNQKFLPLLAKKNDGEDKKSVFSIVFELLVSKAVHSSVTSMIMDIVENLLCIDEEEAGVRPGRKVETEMKGPGVELLIPHVPSIVAYLHGVVKSMTSRGTKKFALPVKDIRILARLSCYVTNSKLCGEIVDLLIPFLAKCAAKDESMERDILSSVQHLLVKAEGPDSFLWSLGKLFSVISGRLSRRSLCDVVKTVAGRCPGRESLAEIVSKLNAWDRRRVDEVDYDSRLDAYSEINDFIRDMQDVDVIYLNFVIHNAAYFLRTSDDMSLRDSASHCLQLLVERLGEVNLGQDAYQRLVDGAILPQIRVGLKLSNETPRNEFIKILALSVRSFPQNKVILPMVNLMNFEDVEVDIFMNLIHIQVHRRGRAMRRLIQVLPGSEIKTECLTLYLLPIVSNFVSDSYTKHPAVIDAAVDCIGAIAKLLPWSKYIQLLKSRLGYLTKSMSMQKVMVKVIVAILDAFHFDIRSEDLPEASQNNLNNEAPEQIENEDNDVDDDAEETGAENEVDKLTREQVQRIRDDLLKVVVPQLKSAFAKKAKSDDEHKKAKSSKYAEDEEILRVPIALALVKLLQQFPITVLKTHLPGLLLKVCEFLRSRAKDIRDTARDTLTKILASLGHTYFPFVLAELQGALKRGYQVHVLVYTVVTLLNSMKPVLKSEMLDSSIAVIVDILNQELFGDVAEEKEVEGITNKFHEAKAIKSYDGYEIVATYIGKGMLGKLLVPLKEVLSSTNSHKTNKKIEEVLKRISAGLIENKDLDVEALMVFVHGLVNDTLPMLQEKKEQRKKVEVKPGQQPPSALVLEKATPRGGLKPHVDKKSNSNILIEFGLQLLHNLLKRSKLSTSEQKHKELLDPFVPVLSLALDSKHVRVISWTMRCLTWILSAQLPSLRKHVSDITKRLFTLLKDYAAAGAAKGDNQELVMACFKALTVLVRDVNFHTLSTDQIRVLLLYIEEDIHDNTRQATAFTLLRAILIRQLMIPEMADVMMKVCKLSVTSDSPQTRQKCRQVILKFLLDYPLGKKVRAYLQFFIAQLTYEMEPGRESVLEMMASMFTNFPNSMMEAYSLLFFMPLATRLINDESTRCRKLVSLAVKSLLGRVSLVKRDEIVTMVSTWLNDSNYLHQQLAVIILGLMVEVENVKFDRRLDVILPLISHRIEPHRFSEDVDEATKSGLDKVLYSSLNCVMKIFTHCPSVIRNRSQASNVGEIWSSVRNHLLYPHQWVRLVAAQIIGLLFAAWSPDEVAKPNKSCEVEFLGSDSELKMRGLALDLVKLFKQVTLEDTGEQVVKNLVFVAKCAWVFECKAGPTESDETEKSRVLRLEWLIRKMCREATYEATQNVKSTLKRKCVYKWLAAVSADLGSENLPMFLRVILPPLVRDTSDKVPNLDESLKTLAQEVLDFIKNTAGIENFLKHYTEIQKSAVDRVEKRKREKAVQAVANPEIHSRKRIKKNLQKRDAKKRKIATMRPSKGVKKRKVQDIAITD